MNVYDVAIGKKLTSDTKQCSFSTNMQHFVTNTVCMSHCIAHNTLQPFSLFYHVYLLYVALQSLINLSVQKCKGLKIKLLIYMFI